MQNSQETLLTATRWIVILTIGFAALASIVLVVAGTGITVFWGDIAPELAKEHPGLVTGEVKPLLIGLMFAVLPLIGLAIWSLLKLLAIVDSVRNGDPFTRINAARLRTMGWLMVALQVLSIPFGALAAELSSHFESHHVSFDMSLNGILAILLVFVLAGVFEQGAAMREELEGTI